MILYSPIGTFITCDPLSDLYSGQSLSFVMTLKICLRDLCFPFCVLLFGFKQLDKHVSFINASHNSHFWRWQDVAFVVLNFFLSANH